MSRNVVLTPSARSNLLSLKKTRKQSDVVQERLASGYRVNSAMDNPSSYFTAQALNYRADDLSTLLDGIGQAISTLETADTGLTTLNDFVKQAKAIAQSARDTPNVPSKLEVVQASFNPETAKSDKITDVLHIPAGESLTLRSGKATEMTETTNVNASTTLKECGIVNASSVEFMVGEARYVFSFSNRPAGAERTGTDGTVYRNLCVTDTLEKVGKDIAYTTNGKVSATVEDGNWTFKTTGNEPLMIRSSSTIALRGRQISSADIGNLYFSDADFAKLSDSGKTKVQAKLNIDGNILPVPHNADAWEIAQTINNDSSLRTQGFAAEIDVTGNLIVFNEQDDTKPATLSIAKENKSGLTASVNPPAVSSPGGKVRNGQSYYYPADGLRLILTGLDNKGTENDFVLKSEQGLAIKCAHYKADITDDLRKLLNGEIQQFPVYVSAFNPDTTDSSFDTVMSETGGHLYNVFLEDDKVVLEPLRYAFSNRHDNGNISSDSSTAYWSASSIISVTQDVSSTAVNTMEAFSFNELLGFDSGTDITVDANTTVESFRLAFEAIDGIKAQIDGNGRFSILGINGDDIVLADRHDHSVTQKLYGANMTAATNGVNERARYAKRFDALLNQIDMAALDSSYKGINLLNGDDLTVVFNETRTSSLALKGVVFDSTGLGLTVSKNEWLRNEQIDVSLDQLNRASARLRKQSAIFGQNLSTILIRKDFTDGMINKLESGSDKLTLADTNEEAANMLALQTRQSLATNSLSLSNQAAQNVLKLF